MIVAVASRKASPGTTSLTAWLAAFWPEQDVFRVVLEADPSGGTLAAWWSEAHRLTWDPGLLAFSTSRRRLDAATLPSLTQLVDEDLAVAAAPPVPNQVTAALQRLGDDGAAELASAGWARVFADCGRLTASSPAISLARQAEITVLACRPQLHEVYTLVPAVAELTEAGCSLGLVCIGDGPYDPSEIARTAGIELLGTVPHDQRAADAFRTDGFGVGRAFHRSALATSLAELADVVAARCGTDGVDGDDDEYDDDLVGSGRRG